MCTPSILDMLLTVVSRAEDAGLSVRFEAARVRRWREARLGAAGEWQRCGQHHPEQRRQHCFTESSKLGTLRDAGQAGLGSPSNSSPS